MTEVQVQQAIMLANFSLFQQALASLSQKHIALRAIADSSQGFLSDAAAFVVDRHLDFESAVVRMVGQWGTLILVIDGTTGEGDEFAPTYALLRNGTVTMNEEQFTRFQRLAVSASKEREIPIAAYVTILHGLNSCLQLESFFRAAGRDCNFAQCVGDVLAVEANLAQGADFSSVLSGFDGEKTMRVNTKVVSSIETGEVIERESYPYSGPVELACQPSSAMKNLNQQVQQLSSTMTSEAKTVFGASSSVFNNLIGGIQQIVNGGPSQAGFSTAELQAKNAQAVQEGATLARNAGGAAASSAAAIGGGNAVTPAGGTEAAVLDAKIQAGEQTANAENTIQQQNYAQGNANYEAAVGQETKLPSVFTPSNAFNESAASEQQTALKSQQNIDTQNNWWQPLVMKAASAGLSAATGGMSNFVTNGMGNTSSDSSFGENVGNFFSGGASGGGTMPTPSPSTPAPFGSFAG